MRKLVVTVVMVLGLTGVVFAQNVRTNIRKIELGSGTTTFTLNRNSVAYTDTFPLSYGEYFCLAYRFQSAAGSPNVRMELQQSDRAPAIDRDADTFWVVPDNLADIATGVTSETQHYISISPAPLPYGRIKITEAGVSDDTNATISVFVVGDKVNSQ